MMKIDDIVNGTYEYRAELCKLVQNDSGVECIMLEKDIWVTYVLEKIFADKELSKILRFKARTLLSGDWPRDFIFVSPTLALVAMERSGEVHALRYDPDSGAFTRLSTLSGLFRPVALLPRNPMPYMRNE